MKKISTLLLILILAAKPSFTQVDDKFSILDENEVKKFGKPLVTALGIGMNTGAFHTAKISKLFGFSIGVQTMMIFIPDDQKTFTPSLPSGYVSANGVEETATIFGDKGGVYSGPNGMITYPNGITETSLPLVFPQATVSLLGTELLLRYVPLKIEDKSITLFGVGVKHSISQYIPLVPLDFAVQILYNKFDVEDLISSSHLAFSAQASKTFGLFTAYGGLQYESSKLTFDYTIKGDPSSGNPLLQKDRKISAEVEGDNSVRLTVGGAVYLAFLVINVDYSLGSQSVASAGLNFEF
jgi:hypothetical protein